MKGNKGITLIALVITIIVLLILAGVSIAMLNGNNSILGRAKSTVSENELAEGRDEVGLAWNAAYADYLEAFYANNQTVGTFSSYLSNRLPTDTAKYTKFKCEKIESDSKITKITLTSVSDPTAKIEAEVTDSSTAGSSTKPATVTSPSMKEWTKVTT